MFRKFLDAYFFVFFANLCRAILYTNLFVKQILGQIVGAAAGKTLTPTVLELGGKSPVYVDKNYPNMVSMVDRIAWGKTCNSGECCYFKY
jgi:hypothetical protein